MTEFIRNLATASKCLIVGGLVAASAIGCAADTFPDCCDATGVRDVPYAVTYRFNFRTGSFDIAAPNPDRIFGILTQADVMTLMNAAAVTQSTSNGLISGTLIGPRGPLREASVVVRDADGNVVSVTETNTAEGRFRNFFFNSLGQVPDFLVSEGSTDQGTFTMFNAPPGELFFHVVSGGRGNGRITAYPAAVSIGKFNVLEVFPPRVGVLGVVVDGFANTATPNAWATIFGWQWTNEDGRRTTSIRSNAGGLFLIPPNQGVTTQGRLILSLSDPAADLDAANPTSSPLDSPTYRTTFYQFETPISRVLTRQQAFDPITLDNLVLYPKSGLQAWYQTRDQVPVPPLTLSPSAGVIIGRVTTPDGTGVGRSILTAKDITGGPLDDQGIHVYYFRVDVDVAKQVNPRPSDPNDLASYQTSQDGRYMIVVPDCSLLADGRVYLNAVARTITLPPSLETGRATAPCMPGGVFVQDVVLQDYSSGISTYYTTSLKGRVIEDNAQPVEGAQVQILGSGAGPYTTDAGGTFDIPRGASPTDIEPVLAFSPYTVRLSKASNPGDPAYIPTYVNVVTGLDGAQQDVIIVPQSLNAVCVDQDPNTDDRLTVYGVVRDVGALDPSRKGLPVEGISIQVLDAAGKSVTTGRVVYRNGAGAAKTGVSGLFAVCGLAVPSAPSSTDPIGSFFPAMYQIQVSSQEDSGAIPVEVFNDGVAMVNLVVNKAFPAKIPTTGQLTSLLGPEGTSAIPVSDATISVRGDVLSGTTGGDGRLTINLSLDSNGTYILRATKTGYLPTLNYHVSIPARLRQDSDVLPLPPLVIASQDDLDQAGIPRSASLGIVAGKAMSPGFASPQPLAANFGEPVRLIAGFFDTNDLYPDVLAVYSDRAQFLHGNGAGGFLQPAPAAVSLDVGGGSITAVAPADFDADGNTDVAVIGNQQLYVFYGTASGGYETGQLMAMPDSSTPYAVSVVDLDADGDVDIVVATNGANPLVRFINKTGVSFALNTGDPVGDTCDQGLPRAVGVEVPPGTGANAILIGTSDGSLCVYPFNANGNPLAMKLVSLGSPALWMEPAFLDTDALPDMVILQQSGVSVLLGVASTATLPAPITRSFSDFSPGFSPTSALVGDVNLDTRNDLLVSGSGGVLFFLGAGNGEFNRPVTLLGPGVSPGTPMPAAQMTGLDLDGDGRGDLIAVHPSDATYSLAQFRGINVAGPGVRLEVRDEGGQSVGKVFYLDDEGAVAPTATQTLASGRFVVADVPTGFAMARVAQGGSGNAIVTSYPGTVSYAEVSVNPVPGTITVTGQTIDPIVTETSGTIAGSIRVAPLGTGVDVRSSAGAGPTDPTTGTVEFTLDANSEYILKLRP